MIKIKRWRSNLQDSLYLTVVLCLLLLVQQSWAQVGTQIFKVMATDCDEGRAMALTGFLVNDPEKGIGLVTALHGVAGCKAIAAANDSGNGYGELQLTSVDFDNDVALLASDKLLSDIQQQSLGIVISNNLTDRIYTIGYPLDLQVQLDRDFLRLRDTATQQLRYLVSPIERANLEACKSPNLEITVFSIEGALVPGESGAPILNTKNEVIGITEGGLQQGRAEISWATRWEDIRFVEASSLADLLTERAASRCLTDISTDVILGGDFAMFQQAIDYFNAKLQVADLGSTQRAEKAKDLQQSLVNFFQAVNDKDKQELLELLADGKIEEALLKMRTNKEIVLQQGREGKKQAEQSVQTFLDYAILQTFLAPEEALESLQAAFDLEPYNPKVLKELGSIQVDLGQYSAALESWQALLFVAQFAHDSTGEANALILLGLVYEKLGEKEQAISYQQEGLALHQKNGDRTGEANALASLGSVYTSLAQYDQAINQYDQALVVYRELSDRGGEENVLSQLGLVYTLLGQPDEALNTLNQALTISREIGDGRGEALTLISVGNVYMNFGMNLGDSNKAISNYEQALELFRVRSDRRGEAQALKNLGTVYWSLGQTEQALSQYQQALVIFQAVRDRAGEAFVLDGLGNNFLNQEKYDEALNSYEQALAIYHDIGDREGEAKELSQLGTIYTSLGQADQSITYHEQALAIHQEIGEPLGEGIDLMYLGVAYYSLNDQQKAIDYFRQARDIFEAVGSPFAQQVTDFLHLLGTE